MPIAIMRVLVVAGGGAGGARHGGGGGGGGVVYNPSFNATEYAYPVTVGSGGIPDPAGVTVGGNGRYSSFDVITALGGGGGGSYTAPVPTGGGSGGGGGGAAYSTAGLANQLDSGGGSGYGHNGGAGYAGGLYTGGGGGGGANTTGSGAPGTDTGGAGGYGFTSDISGVTIAYGGGGGGGGNTAGGYGYDGGGNGGISSATNGTAYLGGGGGGNRSLVGGTKGGYGGSGVVIISYDSYSLTATGGIISQVDGKIIHKFETSGTFTVTSAFPLYRYRTTGIVTENLSPAIRTLRLYRESTGQLMHETTSSGNGGSYELKTPYNENHYVVCLDAAGGNNYNHLIAKDIDIEEL